MGNDIEKLAKECATTYSKGVYLYGLYELKKFAEAYHKAKWEQAEPVGYLCKSPDGVQVFVDNKISLPNHTNTAVYTAPQDQSAEIERLRAQVQRGKELLMEEMGLKDERTKIVIEQRGEIERLKELLRRYIRTYRVDDQAWNPEEETDRIMQKELEK